MSNDKKSYYAIIPANVRYDKRLTANAKLLYGEITALCNEQGYCWASNDYFASLYEVSKQSISHWIKQLCDFGYIKSDLIYEGGTKEIKARYLTLLLGGTVENYATPTVEKFKDNTTSLNNTVNNTTNTKRPKQSKDFIPPIHDQVEQFIIEKQLCIDPSKFIDWYSKTEWKDNQGKPIQNWKNKLISWDAREREKNPAAVPYSKPKPREEYRPKSCPKCGSPMTGLSCPSCFTNFDSEGNEV